MSFASLIGITPEKGMQLLKAAIKDTLKRPISNFNMIYDKTKQLVIFKVWFPDGTFKKLPYDESKKLCIILDMQLKPHIPKDTTLSYAIIRSENMNADLYIDTPQGKEKQTISLI